MIDVKIMARFLRRRRFKHTFFNLYSQERQKTSHGRKTSKNLPSSCSDSCAFAPRPSLQPSFERNRLTVVCRAQIAPSFNTDRIGEEAHGTVGKSRVDPASMPASSGKSERLNRRSAHGAGKVGVGYVDTLSDSCFCNIGVFGIRSAVRSKKSPCAAEG